MPFAAPLLTGKRVLIVEDEALVAMLVEDLLKEYGCSVIGPCGTVEAAMEAAQSETFDLAVLDVNLHGYKVYPVAEYLAEHHVPFLFLSGYGDEAVPLGHKEWKVCAKPFRVHELVAMLQGALATATS